MWYPTRPIETGSDLLTRSFWIPEMSQVKNDLKSPELDARKREVEAAVVAQYGDMTRGPRVVTDETKAEMRQILKEIQNGEFAREFIQENQSGQITLQAKRRIGREHPIEEVGERLRGMMPWIKKIVDKSKN